MDTERKCETCRYYLGNGCCRLDLEDECAAGGLEAWEERGVCMDYKLKPCPFCGGKALGPTDAWPHMVTCEDCGAGVKGFQYAGTGAWEAIQKWNRREPETTRSRLQVHNICNVDIPEGVSKEDFHKVMNNVVEALEHTERGESWPYETGGETNADG